jgi:cytoskeletal protein CcmA (bactofilin family)
MPREALQRRQDPMIKKAPGGQGSAFEAVLGASCEFNGTARLPGNACIEGRFKGEVISDGELIVAESAELEASIQGVRVQVFGKVVGDIVCSDRLEIFTGAQVLGTISSPRLVIHDGVIFDGRCHMRSVLAGTDGEAAAIAAAEGKAEGKVVEISAREAAREQSKRSV